MILFLVIQLFLAVSIASANVTSILDVFISGEEGYSCYRIPAIVIHPSTGELLAFAEARKYNCNDHGYVDIAMKKSLDNGNTWSKLIVIRSESSSTINTTIGNPSPFIALDVDGSILLFLPFCRNNIGNVGLLKSYDFGNTFNYVSNISVSQSWTWVATGPPGGLQVGGKGGRLLIPFNQISQDKTDHALAFFSDDLGLTWSLSSNSILDANECQIAYLPWVSPSTVLLSMRSATGSSRYASLSSDSGITWENRYETIQETHCEASTISLPATKLIVMSSAFSTTSRTNMTLHISRDDGKSWYQYAQLYSGLSAYSALVDMNSSIGTSVGCLFEKDGYKSISFVITTVK